MLTEIQTKLRSRCVTYKLLSMSICWKERWHFTITKVYYHDAWKTSFIVKLKTSDGITKQNLWWKTQNTMPRRNEIVFLS